jgi:hypothetical protein
MVAEETMRRDDTESAKSNGWGGWTTRLLIQN